MADMCAYCTLDTGGNHEWDCPLHPISSNPTPKLTAEMKGLLSDLCERPITDQDVAVLRLSAVISTRVEAATRQAFEQAAEIRPRPPMGMQDGYVCAWADAVRAYTAAIRALTEEQTDGG